MQGNQRRKAETKGDKLCTSSAFVPPTEAAMEGRRNLSC